MGLSRVDCVHIHHPNCPYYLDGRFCPNPCEGFVQKEPSVINVSITHDVIIDEPESQITSFGSTIHKKKKV
jgi:hypothetical protein